MTLKKAERLLRAKKSPRKENTVSLTCVKCNRPYWATEAFGVMVKAGRLESICGQCDGSHDDHDYPAEVENEDEEIKHGISGDDIDKAEYQHGDR